MSIADLIQSRQLQADERLTVELEFLPGFQVTLAHMTPDAYKRITRDAHRTVFVKHQSQTVLDEKKLADLVAGHIVAWKGLNARMLSRMFWLKIADLSEEEKTAEIPYSPEEGASLLRRHDGFSSWVVANALNQAHFTEALEGAEKNLPSGSDIGPSPAESPATAAEPSATN
ncbi:MAG: hypothetical protein V1797_20825 [Pseudomonadota bacterium]